ncbi:hypothetical protein [Novosphingobium sp. M1R2S20]|uniref:Uncharacterized protein n=1 Tax=Novosphingobium rhizovicinum TaxID=3228928 RepID=A0ABV3RF74_9SPHN
MTSFSDIIALQGDKYSPNLRAWLTKQSARNRSLPLVYADKDGDKLIGWIDEDQWFIGSRLNRVLGVGRKADVWCWTIPTSSLTELDEFWQRYTVAGRCAIDTEHNGFFIGEQTRWRQAGDTRECLWCDGFWQVQVRWTECVARSRWEAAA